MLPDIKRYKRRRGMSPAPLSSVRIACVVAPDASNSATCFAVKIAGCDYCIGPSCFQWKNDGLPAFTTFRKLPAGVGRCGPLLLQIVV